MPSALRRALRSTAVVGALVLSAAGCTSVAQVTSLAEPACADVFEQQLRSILVEQGETPEVAALLASRTRLALTHGDFGPRPFLVDSPSGADYGFFIQAQKSGCLLRLFERRKGFTTYRNNLTYIATEPLAPCTCSE